MSLMWGRRRRRYGHLVAQHAPVVVGATGPRLPEMAIPPTGGRTQFVSRHSMVLGRRMRWIQIGFVNAYFGGSGLNSKPPTALSLAGAKIRGSSWSSPISWLDTSPTVTPTVAADAEILTVRLGPADLGLSSFEAGQEVWLDMSGTLPSSIGRFPVGPIYTFNGGVGRTGFFAIYDRANHIDQLGTEGDMVAPTDALLGSAFGATGFDGETPGPTVPPNNMCVGASFLIGEVL